MLQVFKPSFGDEELEALREVLQSGWVGQGPKVAEFEEAFAAHVGAAHAVATNSCTAALHLACLALGLGPGDEVIVPALTFTATAHAVEYCGATAVFCDVEDDTLTLDPFAAEPLVTPHTRALIPVHYGGHACRMDALWDLAAAHGLAVIEDAAHAAGTLYRGRPVGGLERTALTTFSFGGVHYLPLHLQPYYRDREHAPLPVTEQAWTELLTLPLYPDLTDADADRVVEAILAYPRE